MHSSTTSEASGFFGQRVAEHFAMPGRSVSEFRLGGQMGLAATRLSCDKQFRERTRTAPCEDAFSILYQVEDLEWHSCWLGGRRQHSGRFNARAVSVVDLRDDPQWQFKGRFSAMQFYVPTQALSAIADEHGAAPITALRWERGARDDLLWALSEALLHAAAGGASSSLLVDQLSLSLLTHFAQAYGGLEPASAGQFGRLAAWQERRAKEIMAARLASNLTIAQVAGECRLTASHFARAFRKSTGVAPHRYLTQLRIEAAKQHLSRANIPLSDIALICGFGDQSHFTRVFRQFVGASPGAWRRSRGGGAWMDGAGSSPAH